MRLRAAIAAMGIAGVFMVLLVPFTQMETSKNLLQVLRDGGAVLTTYLWILLPLIAGLTVFVPVRWLPAAAALLNVLVYVDSLRQLSVAGTLLPNGNAFAFWGLYGPGFWIVVAWMVVLLVLAVAYWRMPGESEAMDV